MSYFNGISGRIACAILLFAGAALAIPPDELQPPVFVECPDTIWFEDGVPVSAQFRAVIPNQPNARGRIRYRLERGYGSIDERTGLWSWVPQPEGRRPIPPVLVSARIHNSEIETSMDQWCEAMLIGPNRPPRFVGLPCGATVVSPNEGPEHFGISFRVIDSDRFPGNGTEVFVRRIEPPPALGYVFEPAADISESNTLAFDITAEESAFEIELGATDGLDTSYCSIGWVRTVQEPVTIAIEQEGTEEWGCRPPGPAPLDTIDITIGPTDQRLVGFTLTVAMDFGAFSAIEVLPGDVFDNCGWQHFTWRKVATGAGGLDFPDSVLTMKGSAYVDPENLAENYCPGPESTAVLARIVVAPSGNPAYVCQYLPARFAWTHVASNHIITAGLVSIPAVGERYLISRSVFEFDETEITDTTAELPTYFGTPAGSSSSWMLRTVRLVELHNGGYDIVCTDSAALCRGDVNCNYVTPEREDLALFGRVLVQDTEILDDEECSAAGSDVTADGNPWTIEDFTYLARQVSGDMVVPYPLRPDSIAASFIVTDAQLTVVTSTALGAVRVVFDGEVYARIAQPGLAFTGHYDPMADETRYLLYSVGAGPGIATGGLLSEIEPATALIKSIEAATYDGYPVAETVGRSYFQVAIEYSRFSYSGAHESVDITISSNPFDLWGFDLTVSFDRNALIFQMATQGTVFDSCDWEYFSYRYIAPDPADTTAPSGLIRIIGIAETNNGDQHPTCFATGAPFTLATLDFLVTPDRSYEGTWQPIRFYWQRCRDNNFAYKISGSYDPTTQYSLETAISRHVYDWSRSPYYPYVEDQLVDVTDGNAVFPTAFGASDDCLLSDGTVSFQSRSGDFVHGGLWILGSDVQAPCSDHDLDLNGTPYQLQDAILYREVLVWGRDSLSAVYPHLNWLAADEISDVNCDQVPWTIEDLVLQLRITLGDALQFPSPPQTTATRFRFDSQVLSVDSDTVLGGLFCKVTGRVTPTLLSSGVEIQSAYHDSTNLTHILILGCTEGAGIASGPIVSYDASTDIVHLEAATYDGARLHVSMLTPTGVDDELPLPAEFALSPNYPNPFNLETVIPFALPTAGGVTVEIFDVLGRQVYRHDRHYGAGRHTFTWDGRARDGRVASSGVYYYRISSNGQSATRKMVLLK